MPRVVEIPCLRLRPWLANFTQRHGELSYEATPDCLQCLAADGAHASITVPWQGWEPSTDPEDLITHLAIPRRFGVVLARKSAHAVGIVAGTKLVASSVDRHYVQGRTKAGGWSQQRYARRRGNQAKAAFQDAADDVVELLLPELGDLDYLIAGGEQVAITAVLADPRLAPLAPLRAVSPARVWPTPDPRKQVLLDFITTFQSLSIELNDKA